jgi:hypothetical protein
VKVPSKAELESLAGQQWDALVLREIGRARKRIHGLERQYPSADTRELAQRLIDSKKTLASTSGAISGLFGLLSVPADLLVVTYLQTILLVELATLHQANLKNEAGRDELLDVLGYANGVGPIVRAGPKLLGRIALTLFERASLPNLGRAFPVVAAPVTAYLNNKAIDRVGLEGLRHYGRSLKQAQRADPE